MFLIFDRKSQEYTLLELMQVFFFKLSEEPMKNLDLETLFILMLVTKLRLMPSSSKT